MRKALFLLVSPVTLAACNDSLEVPGPRPFGIVQLITASGPNASPTQIEAVFYRGTSASIPDSRTANDQCVDTFYSAPTTTPVPNTVSAGDALSLVLGSSTVSVPKIEGSTGISYGVTAGSVSFTPGVQANLSIPGQIDGFPAAQSQVKTAEAFTPAPVPIKGVGNVIDVSWSPAGDAESAMLVSLRYSSAGQSTVNRQVFCAFRDNDGTGEIDQDALTGWTQTNITARQVVFTRYRTKTTVFPAGNSVLYLASSHIVNGQVATTP
jgi:hypothetical protein